MQPTECIREYFVYLFPSSNIQNSYILITISTYCFQIHIYECFNFSTYNFRKKINNKSVKWNFSHLTLTEKTVIKNLGCATPILVLSKLSSIRKQTYVRIFNPVIYSEHKWLGGCAERNTLFFHACCLQMTQLGQKLEWQI